MVHFGPKMAKHGRLVNVRKWSKRLQKGPMVNLSVFDHLGPFLAHLDPFGPVQKKNWTFAPKHFRLTLLCPFEAKKIFLSEMVQNGPDGPKSSKTLFFLQDFSTVLKSFCPVESKNSFILVQANFHCFYPQSAIFSNFWGRYIAFQELNVHCWAWTMVRCPSYWKVYFYDFRFLGSSLAHREPKL